MILRCIFFSRRLRHINEHFIHDLGMHEGAMVGVSVKVAKVRSDKWVCGIELIKLYDRYC